MPVYRFADFELDLDLCQLRQRGKPIEISPRPLDLLIYLIRNRHRTVPKKELIERVWGAAAMSPSTVPTCVAALRNALGDDPASPRFVETARGHGYRFVASIAPQQSAAGDAAVPRQRAAPFVGRERELAELAAALVEAESGRPQLALLTGEPGIGKTRTVDEFLSRSTGASHRTLLARCHEGDGAPAFWPWVQIMRAYLERADARSIGRTTHGVASILADMVPELRHRLPRIDPAPALDAPQARFRLSDAVAVFLRRAAEDHSLVLFLDDLHRADLPSLLLLRFAVREAHGARILFVGTYRELEMQQDPTLSDQLAGLAREAALKPIRLGPLTLEDVTHFLEGTTAGRVSDDRIAAALHDKSGGNPFFLTQLMDLLKSQGRLDARELASDAVALPAGLREVITKQLGGVPQPTRQVLTAAAVIGRRFHVAVVANVADEPHDRILELLGPALDSGVVTEDPDRPGAFRFAHILLRDALYDDLPPARRVRLHRATADALEEIHRADPNPHAAELAYHLRQATGAAAARKAMHYATRAGEWAIARHAYEDAAPHFQAALEAFDASGSKSAESRCELQIRLAEAQLAAGRQERARATLAEVAALARRLPSPKLLARSALALAPGFFATEVGIFDPLLVSLLEEALATAPQDDDATRAQLLARLAIALVWSDSESRREALSREALELARTNEDPETLAYALSARHGVLWHPAQRPEREAVIEELGRVANALRSPQFALIHCLFRITYLLERGEIVTADLEIASFSRQAEALQLPHFLWQTKLLEAMRRLMAGRFVEAERAAEEFFAIGQRAQLDNTLHSVATHLAIQRLEQGRAGELLPGIGALVERYPAVVAWRCAHAHFLAELGQLSEARAEVERIASGGLEKLPRNESWTISLNLLAEVCGRLEDAERAQPLYALLLPASASHVVIGFSIACWGSQDRALGILATTLHRWEEAQRHFELALEQNERVGALPWLAHTHHDYARMLHARGADGDHRRAEEHSRAALTICERLGMTNLMRKIRNPVGPRATGSR